MKGLPSVSLSSRVVPGPHWEQISSDSKRLVAGLLAVDAARRLTPDDVLAALGVDADPTSFKLAVSAPPRHPASPHWGSLRLAMSTVMMSFLIERCFRKIQ